MATAVARPAAASTPSIAGVRLRTTTAAIDGVAMNFTRAAAVAMLKSAVVPGIEMVITTAPEIVKVFVNKPGVAGIVIRRPRLVISCRHRFIVGDAITGVRHAAGQSKERKRGRGDRQET
jgi:predicted oxidoreductase